MAGMTEDAKVYEVTSKSAKLPPWKTRATAKARKKLRQQQAQEAADGVQILQDFEMPSVSQRVKYTEDGGFVVVSGTYPPMVKCYECSELSMKFQRNLDCEIVDFVLLDDDWKKMAFLLADRVVEVHAQKLTRQFENLGQFGSYYKVRVPRFGRDIALLPSSSDVYVCGEGEDVYRLNLEQGRFLTPLGTRSGADGGNNCMSINPRNQLIALGGENGLVDVWDPRNLVTGKPAGTLSVGDDVTSLYFEGMDGLNIGVGTASGQVLLYDVRSAKPYLVKEQGYGLPIRGVKMHQNGTHVVSCDAKSIKAWEKKPGAPNMFAVEPDADINHMCLVGESGLIIVAAETSKVLSYYVPALGLAPKWCSFLDNFTEELENSMSNATAGNIYENYRFVTLEELRKLNLEQMIGTPLLRGYMHGYFMDLRLYRRAVEATEPFAYEAYRKQKIRERIDEERSSRIAAVNDRKTVKVNQHVMDDAVLKASNKKGDRAKAAAAVVSDDRFRAMFENEDFKVDPNDFRYRKLNPHDKPERLDDADVDSDLELEDGTEAPGPDVNEHSVDDRNSSDSESSDELDRDPRGRNGRTSGSKLFSSRSEPGQRSAAPPSSVDLARGIKSSNSSAAKRKKQQRSTLGERARKLE